MVGAGPAGLWAAWRAAEAGHQVTVVERGAQVGGMAASLEVTGLRVDLGSHRLHPSTDPAILDRLRTLLGDDLQCRSRHGRIRLAGRWVAFPLRTGDLLRNTPPRFALGAARDALTGPFRRPRADTFAEVVRAGLGPTVAEEFYGPYVRKLWGVEADELSGELARRRVSASGPGDIARRLLRSARSGGPSFWYPRRGFGQISEALAEAAVAAGADIRLSTEVVTIDPGDVDDPKRPARLGLAPSSAPERLRGRRFGADSPPEGRFAGGAGSAGGVDVEVPGPGTGPEAVEADLVWTTAPIAELACRSNPAPAPEALRAADRLQHRGLVLVYLVSEGAPWTEFDAHYLPGADQLAARVSEPRNYRESADDPNDLTVLCAEVPATVGDGTWTATDADLAARLVDDLGRLGLPAVRPLEVRTVRLPRVYPLYCPGFETDLADLERWLDVHRRVVSFGRQGLFVPDNTHHALAMAEAAAHAVGPHGRFDHPAWARSRDAFRSHVVED